MEVNLSSNGWRAITLYTSPMVFVCAFVYRKLKKCSKLPQVLVLGDRRMLANTVKLTDFSLVPWKRRHIQFWRLHNPLHHAWIHPAPVTGSVSMHGGFWSAPPALCWQRQPIVMKTLHHRIVFVWKLLSTWDKNRNSHWQLPHKKRGNITSIGAIIGAVVLGFPILIGSLPLVIRRHPGLVFAVYTVKHTVHSAYSCKWQL